MWKFCGRKKRGEKLHVTLYEMEKNILYTSIYTGEYTGSTLACSATHHAARREVQVCCLKKNLNAPRPSVVVVDSHIQRIVLAAEETTVTQQFSLRLSNVNPACGHKEVPRSTGHIVMVITRYSDQQGSKSRQKVIRLLKQWHRPMSKRLIRPPYTLTRATSIDSDCCRLPTTSVLSNKADKLRSSQF